METGFINTYKSKNNEPHRLRLRLADKFNFEYSNKNIALVNLNIYYTWKNIKSIYKISKFKIFAPTRNDYFELPDGSYSLSDMQ